MREVVIIGADFFRSSGATDVTGQTTGYIVHIVLQHQQILLSGIILRYTQVLVLDRTLLLVTMQDKMLTMLHMVEEFILDTKLLDTEIKILNLQRS